MSAKAYRVEVEYDPTAPRGMKWSGKVYSSADRTPFQVWEHSISLAFSRRSVERQAMRFIRRVDGRRSYSYIVTRGGE